MYKRQELAGRLAALPAGARVLLDGLVACGVPEIVLPHARRLRLAVLVHLPLAAETGLPPALAADLDARERATLRAVAAVVATSPWTARRLTAHHGLDARRVHTVTPGTDPAPVAPAGDGTRLLCVAALSPRKGHDLLVTALADLGATPWTCDVVGAPGPDPGWPTRLRRLIDGHGLTGRVRLTGPKAGAELAAAYAAADLLVLPSRAETYGMVVAEALARGVPVLATAVDGVPGTLGRAPDGTVPGMLVPPENPAALTTALRHWLGDADLRRRLTASARGRRETLAGWTTTARHMDGVLRRLHRRPGRTARAGRTT